MRSQTDTPLEIFLVWPLAVDGVIEQCANPWIATVAVLTNWLEHERLRAAYHCGRYLDTVNHASTLYDSSGMWV